MKTRKSTPSKNKNATAPTPDVDVEIITGPVNPKLGQIDISPAALATREELVLDKKGNVIKKETMAIPKLLISNLTSNDSQSIYQPFEDEFPDFFDLSYLTETKPFHLPRRPRDDGVRFILAMGDLISPNQQYFANKDVLIDMAQQAARIFMRYYRDRFIRSCFVIKTQPVQLETKGYEGQPLFGYVGFPMRWVDPRRPYENQKLVQSAMDKKASHLKYRKPTIGIVGTHLAKLVDHAQPPALEKNPDKLFFPVESGRVFRLNDDKNLSEDKQMALVQMASCITERDCHGTLKDFQGEFYGYTPYLYFDGKFQNGEMTIYTVVGPVLFV